jgi:hypothetical protein
MRGEVIVDPVTKREYTISWDGARGPCYRTTTQTARGNVQARRTT